MNNNIIYKYTCIYLLKLTPVADFRISCHLLLSDTVVLTFLPLSNCDCESGCMLMTYSKDVYYKCVAKPVHEFIAG